MEKMMGRDELHHGEYLQIQRAGKEVFIKSAKAILVYCDFSLSKLNQESMMLKIFFSVLILLVLDASNAGDICSPSSCGIIHNISFPFRLKNDPPHCGYPSYELSCENNVTTLLYLNSQEYRVKAINYHNTTIRLVDASINTTTCSFPNHSLSPYDFPTGFPYGTGFQGKPLNISYSLFQNLPVVASPINFLTCPHPLYNTSIFTELPTPCATTVHSRHTYVKVGHMNISDVPYMCTTELIVMTSWKFHHLKNVSLSEIHDSLVYGFELSWLKYGCSKCKIPSFCLAFDGRTVICIADLGINVGASMILVILAMLACVCVGVTIPAKIIILLTLIFIGFLCFQRWSTSLTNSHLNIVNTVIRILDWTVLLIIAVRILICPCLVGFLFYKFRRRHLSMFDVIERFLQGDNKLKPIRYSYSGIEKITRGFREKLGQGGYGSVYKGKLQSGHHVAVKLLVNPRENDQDFMNEISTIGRIHHVNIVKLVGYCAVGSKRAIVYDFMPNGSLDKYIFDQEKLSSLTWHMRLEIALGVARGIHYLHKGCDIQILHFDIKPHNILLDDKFIPKISDFGLAKFCSREKDTVSMTTLRGTVGYVAPELINRGIGEVSHKADVYSFGMLLIEMAGLKRDLRRKDQSSSKYFPSWIYNSFEQGIDIETGISCEDECSREIGKKMTIVALWCIQMNPGDRPSMNKVLDMLEGQMEHLEIPNRPSESPHVGVNEEESSYGTDFNSMLYNDDDSTSEITLVHHAF